MNIFGMGPLELVLVFVVALIVLGPVKMVETASSLGNAFREFQHSMTEWSGRADAAIREEYVKEVQEKTPDSEGQK